MSAPKMPLAPNLRGLFRMASCLTVPDYDSLPEGPNGGAVECGCFIGRTCRKSIRRDNQPTRGIFPDATGGRIDGFQIPMIPRDDLVQATTEFDDPGMGDPSDSKIRWIGVRGGLLYGLVELQFRRSHSGCLSRETNLCGPDLARLQHPEWVFLFNRPCSATGDNDGQDYWTQNSTTSSDPDSLSWPMLKFITVIGNLKTVVGNLLCLKDCFIEFDRSNQR